MPTRLKFARASLGVMLALAAGRGARWFSQRAAQ